MGCDLDSGDSRCFFVIGLILVTQLTTDPAWMDAPGSDAQSHIKPNPPRRPGPRGVERRRYPHRANLRSSDPGTHSATPNPGGTEPDSDPTPDADAGAGERPLPRTAQGPAPAGRVPGSLARLTGGQPPRGYD